MVYEGFFLFVVVCANLKLAESCCTSVGKVYMEFYELRNMCQAFPYEIAQL